MRTHILALLVAVAPGVGGVALGQRIIIIPEHGWGEKVLILSDLPPEAQAAVRQELKQNAQLGFLFWRCYAFKEGFYFWTWNGRFVLYADGMVWEVPPETLIQWFGSDERLAVPWSYRIPPGLVTILAISLLIWGLVHFRQRRESRVQRLLTEERFVTALRHYATHLPSDQNPTPDQKRTAISAGIAQLVADGIPARKAEAELRLVLSTIEQQRSTELRDEAYELAMSGEWERAIPLYQEAAVLVEEWNADAARFLYGRIQWCRAEQLRAGQCESGNAAESEERIDPT